MTDMHFTYVIRHLHVQHVSSDCNMHDFTTLCKRCVLSPAPTVQRKQLQGFLAIADYQISHKLLGTAAGTFTSCCIQTWKAEK
jgi:hypothetical protein